MKLNLNRSSDGNEPPNSPFPNICGEFLLGGHLGSNVKKKTFSL